MELPNEEAPTPVETPASVGVKRKMAGRGHENLSPQTTVRLAREVAHFAASPPGAGIR
jgi:hypothetical protein